MKIPFFWTALGLFSGIVCAKFLPISAAWIFISVMGGLPLLFAARGKVFFLPIFVLILFLIGILHQRLSSYAPESFLDQLAGETRKVRLLGEVVSEPELKIKGRKETLSFILKAAEVATWKAGVKEEVPVRGYVQVFVHQPGSAPLPGNRVRLWGDVELPRPVLNPGQFDYGNYLQVKGIKVIFRGYGAGSLRILKASSPSVFHKSLLSLRTYLERTLAERYEGDDEQLFKALVIGKRKGISPEIRDPFMKTGTSHLLAISGLHMGLIAGAFYLLLLMLRFGQKGAACGAALLVVVHVFVAGAGIPVQRAGLMSLVVFISLVTERNVSSLNTFFFALTLILIFDPQAVRSIAFQLSFLSVLALVLWSSTLEEHWKPGETLLRSLIVLVGTFPLVLYHFNVFSCVSVFANLLAIPLFHMALLNVFMGLLFAKIPILSFLFESLARGFLGLGLRWINLCALPSWGYLFLRSPGTVSIAIYYFFLITYCLLRRTRKKIFPWVRPLILSGFTIAAVGFFVPERAAPFRLEILSSGKNEIYAMSLEGDTHWLINTGRGAPSGQVRWVLEPFLKSKGINRVAGAILMDDYKKHTGGIHSLKHNFSLRSLFYPHKAAKMRKDPEMRFLLRGLNTRGLKTGDVIQSKGREIMRVLSSSERGLILTAQHGGAKFLFLPRLNAEVLRALEQKKSEIIDVDFLLLSSQREIPESTLELLFDWMDPEVTVLAYENKELRTHLEERDLLLLNPVKTGSILILGRKNSLQGNDLTMEVTTLLGGRII